MSRLSSSRAVACLGLAGLVLSCSSSSRSGSAAVPCNEAPFDCPTGQTCWPNANGTGFECLNSVAGVAVGASCNDTVGAPTCGDAQLCYQASTSAAGECLAYCDPSSPAHGCASGFTCRDELEFSNNTSLTTYVCVPPTTTTQDSGAPDSSTTDSASAADTSSTTDAGTDAATDATAD